MGQPAAKRGDRVIAMDTHIIVVPTGQPIPVPGHPFLGVFNNGLSNDVKIMGQPAANLDSTAENTPAHIPMGGSFQKPPTNRASVLMGSVTVRINGKPAVRNGDTAITCNDPIDLPVGRVVAIGTVFIG